MRQTPYNEDTLPWSSARDVAERALKIKYTAVFIIMREYYKYMWNSTVYTNWGPPLWSSGQGSWLQIHRSASYSRRYQFFWEVVGLERDPLSLVSTTEELLGRKSSGSGLENRDYGRRDPSCWPRGNFYPQMLALTSPTSGGCSVGIVRSRTQATEFFFFLFFFTQTKGKAKLSPIAVEATKIIFY
jgi:hypothetical protein